MGDPLDVSQPVCTADDLSYLEPEPENACYAPTSFEPAEEDSNTTPICSSEAIDSYAYADDQCVRQPFTSAAPICGYFRDFQSYYETKAREERQAKIGPFLAALPASEEEKKPTDDKVKIEKDQAYALASVWAGLPLALRIYLDQMGLKGSTEIGVAHQSANPALGRPERWHVFEMSAAQSEPPAGGGSGNGSSGIRPKLTPPSGRPTFNINIGPVVGIGLIVGLDLLIRYKAPNLPAELRFPVNVASFFAVNSGLYMAGLIKAPSLGALWKNMGNQMPAMAGWGFLIGLGLHGVGAATGSKDLQFGGIANDLGSTLFSLGLFYTIQGTRFAPLAPGLIADVGVPFTLSSRAGLMAYLRASWSVSGIAGLSLKAPAGGAGVMGGFGQGITTASIFLLGNMAIGVGKEAVFYFGGYSDDPHARLAKLVYETELREAQPDGFIGDLTNGTLGHLLDGIFCLGELVSDDVAKGREYKRQEIHDRFINNSEEFGKVMRFELANAITESIDLGTGEINWSEAEKKIKEIYHKVEWVRNEKGKLVKQDYAQIVGNVYNLLGYTGHIATDAQEVKDLIDRDGSFPSSKQEALVKLALYELKILYQKNDRTLGNLAQRTGWMRVVGEEIYQTPEALLPPDQQEIVNEKIKPLQQLNSQLGAAIAVLENRPK